MGDNELKVIVSDRVSALEVTISGIISELAKMDPGQIDGGRAVIIDGGGVLSINSFGVRSWVNYLEAVCDKASSVVIRRMSPALVSQASMISNFLAGATVESFFTPYCCVECGHEPLQLQQLNDQIPDEGTCPECNGVTEFDELKESYLAFRDSA